MTKCGLINTNITMIFATAALLVPTGAGAQTLLPHLDVQYEIQALLTLAAPGGAMADLPRFAAPNDHSISAFADETHYAVASRIQSNPSEFDNAKSTLKPGGERIGNLFPSLDASNDEVARSSSSFLTVGSVASAQPVRPALTAPAMHLGKQVQTPDGYLSFCVRHPSDCASKGDAEGLSAAQFAKGELSQRWLALLGPSGGFNAIWSAAPASISSVADTAQDALLAQPAVWPTGRLTLVDMINRRINHLIRPMTDQQHYGVDGFWTTPLEDGAGPAYGDCKDYALEKRRALIQAGVPDEDLALATALTPGGELHMVLIVSTPQGEYIADSLTDRLLPWRDVPYTWLARQDRGRPLVWRAVVGQGTGA